MIFSNPAHTSAVILVPSPLLRSPANSPLMGSTYNGTVFNGSAMCVAWTTPVCQNAFYGQNVQTVGVVLPMRPRNCRRAFQWYQHL